MLYLKKYSNHISAQLYIFSCIFFPYLLPLVRRPQTPFTFGLNQRAPYTAGDCCLLCRCERKDCMVPSEAGVLGQNGTAQSTNSASALQLPLWVCSDCRLTVEKEDRRSTLEQSLGVSQLYLKRFVMVNCNVVTTKALFLKRKVYICVLQISV